MRTQFIISSSITVLIIIVLVIIGDASALSLNFKSDKSEVISGNEVNFNLQVNIDPGDPKINSLLFSLTGPENSLCSFDVAGNTTKKCKGIIIEKSDNGYGYGYGYSYGYGSRKLMFKITFDTNGFLAGDYIAKIVVKAGNKTISQQQAITIKEIICSIRAKGKDNTFNDTTLKNARVNLFVTKGNAKKGEGYLIMQGKRRVTLTFSENRVLEDSKKQMILRVNGELQINRNKVIQLKNTLVIIDKVNKKVIIKNQTYDLYSETEIYFMKNC